MHKTYLKIFTVEKTKDKMFVISKDQICSTPDPQSRKSCDITNFSQKLKPNKP